MNRSHLLAVAGVAAMAVTSSMAFAGSPHFIKNATDAQLSGANLVVDFKEAGLPSGAEETVTVSCSESLVYECVNNGGKNPSASNKSTFQTTGGASGEFKADKNGNIEDSLTITPKSAQDLGFDCPNGQTVTFVSVTYSQCTLNDTTSGASLSFPGSFDYSNPNAPPVR
jgi:hypothetical protein